jgi:hypothetical protein
MMKVLNFIVLYFTVFSLTLPGVLVTYSSALNSSFGSEGSGTTA